jgi:hypothetical protein
MNYIWPNWSDARGYQTAAEWNAHAQVGTDYFVDTSMNGWSPSSGSIAANNGIGVDGVFYDYNGKPRPASGATSVGAIEV